MSISYGEETWVMSTLNASQIVADVAKTGVIIDGIDEEGNEVTPSSKVLDAYDQSIRSGDIAFIEWMLHTYGHYNVPVLNLDPISMLEQANQSALFMLDDMEHTVLPDIVRAIIYDDPTFLWNRKIDEDLVLQILKADASTIFSSYMNNVFKILREICIKDDRKCRKYIGSIHGSIADLIRGNIQKSSKALDTVYTPDVIIPHENKAKLYI